MEVTQQKVVTEEVTTDVPPAEEQPAEAATAETAAAQGAVAVASEAVALSQATTAQAELTAAAAVDTIGRSMEQRLAEVEQWRAETGTAILTLGAALQKYQEEHSLTHATLNEEVTGIAKRLSSERTKPISEVNPQESVVVENQEAAAVRRRHRLI